MAEAKIGIKHSRETREKMSRNRTGKKYPNRKGHPMTEANKEKLIRINKGIKRSEEFKEKIRKARLKQVFPRKETSIEKILQEELNHREIVYRKHLSVCGVCQPDIVFPDLKIAVFADGDYWHSKDFDNGKIWERDRHQDQVLKENGWTPLRFWGHEIRENAKGCVDRIVVVITHV